MATGAAPHVDGLDVLERIGGTRAQVHRAVVRSSGRVVVVKHAGAAEPTTRAGLRREGAVLGRVRHPTLQQLLDVHDDEHGTTLVLARHVGGDLAAHLRGRGPLDTATVAALGARVARALAALHAVDVLHRDVRAANVLLDAGGRAILADLDHALDPASPPLAIDREVVGERGHLDPRLLAGAPADEASDLHALAVTLWQAVTGTLPHGRAAGAPVGRRATADVGHDLLDVLQDLLDDGTSDARAVADRLSDIAGDRPGVLPVPRVVPAGVGSADSPASDRVGRSEDAAPVPTEHAQSVDASQDGLAAAWQADEGTERFGAPGVPMVERLRRRLPRWHLLAAVAGLALVPAVALVVGGAGGDARLQDAAVVTAPGSPPSADATRPVDDQDPGTDRAADGAAPVLRFAPSTSEDAPRPDVGPDASDADELAPVRAPAPCPGTVAPPGGVLADLDGSGCGRVLVHGAEAGVVATADGRRWALGRPGDELLVGDWDGDGRWSPGLHRPSTGEVYLFPPLGEGEVTSAPVQRWSAGGSAVVVDLDGRHGVVVRPDPT